MPKNDKRKEKQIDLDQEIFVYGVPQRNWTEDVFDDRSGEVVTKRVPLTLKRAIKDSLKTYLKLADPRNEVTFKQSDDAAYKSFSFGDRVHESTGKIVISSEEIDFVKKGMAINTRFDAMQRGAILKILDNPIIVVLEPKIVEVVETESEPDGDDLQHGRGCEGTPEHNQQ